MLAVAVAAHLPTFMEAQAEQVVLVEVVLVVPTQMVTALLVLPIGAEVVAVELALTTLLAAAVVVPVWLLSARHAQRHRLRVPQLLQPVAETRFTHSRVVARLHSEVSYGALCKG
jgi:hypothetical protein